KEKGPEACRLGKTRLMTGFGGNNRFGYFFHGFALLAALPAEGEVGFLLAQAGLALQDAFGAFDDLSCFEFFAKLGAFFFEAGHFDFSADEKADGRYKADFGFAVGMRVAVLEIDDADGAATAQQRNGKEGLIAVFGEFIEELEARVLKGVACDSHGLVVFGDPAGDSLP